MFVFTAVELQMFGYQARLVTKSRLRPVRACFSVTCPRLDENDGIFRIISLFAIGFQ